jgi:hypothetical protein
MCLRPFIVIIKELKVYVFNAKGNREIPYGYWRSLTFNLLGNLFGTPLVKLNKGDRRAIHARTLARLASPRPRT